MPEIEHKITWYFILRTNIGSVKLGGYNACLYAEGLNLNSTKDCDLANKFNSLSFDKRRYFMDCPDHDYDPQRDVSERDIHEAIASLGWFEEFGLEYLLSPPNERYVGPGTKEWEELEKFIHDNPGIHISPW